jgi:hypothetical protein
MDTMINILALAILLIGGAEIIYLAVVPNAVRIPLFSYTPVRRLKR